MESQRSPIVRLAMRAYTAETAPRTALSTRRILLLVAIAAVSAAAAWPVETVVAQLVGTRDVPANTLATGAWTNVQTGVATSSANGSLTVAIASVDPAKSFLTFTVQSSGDRPGDAVVRGRIQNATTLEFTRATTTATPPTITIRWYVVSFASGVTVQRGQTTLTASNGTDVAITPVASTSQAFVLFSLTPPTSGDNEWTANNSIAAQLTSASNIRFSYIGNGSGDVSWQVVEFTSAAAVAVQRGTTSMADTATSATITLPTAVDTSKSFVLVSHSINGGNTSDIGAKLLRAQLTGATTLLLDRDHVGVPRSEFPAIEWQVVELKNPTNDPTGPLVQSGSAGFASGTAQATAAISAVNTDRTMAIGTVSSGAAHSMGRSTYSTNDVVGVGTATIAVGASSVTLDRGSTLAAADIGWSVVQFPAKQP